MPNPYKAFGDLLVQLRKGAGFKRQSDFAASSGFPQQTISRWECGTSRPQTEDIRKLAAVLRQPSPDALLKAAGYSGPAPSGHEGIETFTRPLPLSALRPDEFEAFFHQFLFGLYPASAKVHRVGGSGHKQDGLDLEVELPNGDIHSFQCKRHQQFGAAKVKAAIAAHSRRGAKKKVVALSRVASPDARQALPRRSAWEIWDVDDISLRVRTKLASDAAVRLIDTFFKGQRLALLGVPEAGPWMTVEEFFRPFTVRGRIFNHSWSMVGRDDEIAQTLAALSNNDISVVLISGAGGGGKTRLAKEACERFLATNPGHVVRFMSQNEVITKTSLEDLGSAPRLLVVDDAHDRSDLGVLFHSAATPGSGTKVLLLSRPYGVDALNTQSMRSGLAAPQMLHLKISNLKMQQAKDLAKQILKALGRGEEYADDIARITYDCVLAVVIGAYLVAKEKISPALLSNEAEFRQQLLSHFTEIVAGEIGGGADAPRVKKVMTLIALVQPIQIESPDFGELVAAAEGIPSHETNQVLAQLAEVGVLFKRGGQYRLSPDLLSDFLVEKACIGVNGAPTLYADHINRHVGDAQLEHLLVNLGKLDWRLTHQDKRSGRLLDTIWGRLESAPAATYSVAKAVAAVAYYQPERALKFAENLMAQDRTLPELPRLLRHVAYNFEHLVPACNSLWRLGRGDERPLNPHPDHPIRVLGGLCAIEPRKPLEYNRAVVDFAVSLIKSNDAWAGLYTPIDICIRILETEGHTTTTVGRQMHMEPYLVDPDAVADLRDQVVDALLDLLPGDDLVKAVRGAQGLRNALAWPMGLFGRRVSQEVLDEWTKEHAKTLKKILALVQQKAIGPLVWVALLRSIEWHKDHGPLLTKTLAGEIFDLLSDSVEQRAVTAFVDGWGHLSRKTTSIQERMELGDARLSEVANDLNECYPDAADLGGFVERQLVAIKQARIIENSSPLMLCEKLLNKSVPFMDWVIQRSIQEPQSEITAALGSALAVLRERGFERWLEVSQSLMARQLERFDVQVARSLQWRRVKCEAPEYDLFKTLLQSKSIKVVDVAIDALMRLSNVDPRQAIELYLEIDLSVSPKIADDVLMHLCDFGATSFQSLSQSDVERLLDKLLVLSELQGHWIQEFLARASAKFPDQAAKLLFARSEKALSPTEWSYRAVNVGPYIQVPLKFRESDRFSSLLEQAKDWAQSRKIERQSYGVFSDLFVAMFAPFDQQVVDFLGAWLREASADEFYLISLIVGAAGPEFAFTYEGFVVALLEGAQRLGPEAYDDAFYFLTRTTIGAVRGGFIGEPSPADVAEMERATEVLKRLPRSTPAYKFYEVIRNGAEADINAARRLVDWGEDD
jgi:transcriptional regulator with XRE-family HTH domain